MIKLFRIYNQNRRIFLVGFIIIIAIIAILQVLNSFAKRSTQNENVIVNNTLSEYGKNYEAVTGEKKENSTYEIEKNIIKEFLDNCVNGNPEAAYDIISDNCKKSVYPSINDFIDGYYNMIFKDNKVSYNYQAWSEDTYKIEFRNNILSTGIYSDSVYTEDYYTIVGNKLNIFGYIKKQEVNKENNVNNINIKVNNFEYYKDYVICNLNIFNETDKNVLVSSLKNSKDIKIIDENDVEFSFYSNELNELNVMLYSGQNKEISIKFNISYREDLKFKQINFNNIIKDYDKFKNGEIDNSDVMDMQIKL